MGYVTLKIFAMVLVITILTSTTSSIEMTYAIEESSFEEKGFSSLASTIDLATAPPNPSRHERGGVKLLFVIRYLSSDEMLKSMLLIE